MTNSCSLGTNVIYFSGHLFESCICDWSKWPAKQTFFWTNCHLDWTFWAFESNKLTEPVLWYVIIWSTKPQILTQTATTSNLVTLLWQPGGFKRFYLMSQVYLKHLPNFGQKLSKNVKIISQKLNNFYFKKFQKNLYVQRLKRDWKVLIK